MEDILLTMKEETDDLVVEYEILPVISSNDDERQIKIQNEINSIDEQISALDKRLTELNVEIDKLTNHADGIDYLIAVSTGILTGIIDSLFVGEFSLEQADSWGSKNVEKFVKKIAKQQGYGGNDLGGAVKCLEKKYKLAADKATNDFGGGLQHHLRDFSHHPTPIGMVFSMLTQFTNCVYGTDVSGNFKVVPLKDEDLSLIGKSLPEKISLGFVHWIFHLISDVAGSSTSIFSGKRGTGIPGPILSTVKELSSLPIFNNVNDKGYKELSVTISKLFNGTLLANRDGSGNILQPRPFDMRTELGIGAQIGKQAIPVIINECIVRGAFFVRRLFQEIKKQNITSIREINNIYWGNVLPFKNRTITRMITVSMGTFFMIDLADASIRAVIKSGGNATMFVNNLILRVNFVGLGRFAIAIGTEISMELKKRKLSSERIALMNKNIMLSNAKVFYKQADVWITLEHTQKSFEELMYAANQSMRFYVESWNDIEEKMKNIDGHIEDIREKDPDLSMKMLDLLEW